MGSGIKLIYGLETITSLFADITGLLKSSNNLGTLFQTANHEFSEACCWFQANKVTFNVSKTKYIVFRNKSMSFNDQGYNLKIGNKIFERIGSTCKDKYFKFVGVKGIEFLPQTQIF